MNMFDAIPYSVATMFLLAALIRDFYYARNR